jgi:FKBP-type peptidyl-prolyl cis-trans isomerase
MKRQIKLAALVVAATAMLAACGGADKNGFKKTDSGLMYRFENQDKNGQQVQEGDVLVGEMTIKFDSVELFNNVGHADRIIQAVRTFDGDLYEGLMMMHVGDKATFAVDADAMASYLQPNQMPQGYEQGKEMKIYYTITLQDLVSKEDLAQEQANYIAEMEQRKQDEPQQIKDYITTQNIKVQPTQNGVYIVVKKKGNGPKVAAGKTVAINYTGTLLDGTMFDSSVESDAKLGHVYDPRRQYGPMEYIVGQQPMIPGWEEGVMGQPQGTILQLVIPSSMAYGPRGAGEHILPYSPLVFDLEIVSVK